VPLEKGTCYDQLDILSLLHPVAVVIDVRARGPDGGVRPRAGLTGGAAVGGAVRGAIIAGEEAAIEVRGAGMEVLPLPLRSKLRIGGLPCGREDTDGERKANERGCVGGVLERCSFTVLVSGNLNARGGGE